MEWLRMDLDNLAGFPVPPSTATNLYWGICNGRLSFECISGKTIYFYSVYHPIGGQDEDMRQLIKAMEV